MTLPGLTATGTPPPGYVFCVEANCPAVIWKPDTKRPRCLKHQRLQRTREDFGGPRA